MHGVDNALARGVACAAAVPAADVNTVMQPQLASPLRLRPDEWRSGEILWLVDVVGEPAAAAHLLQGLRQGALQGKPLKARRIGPDGRIVAGIVPVNGTDNASQQRAPS